MQGEYRCLTSGLVIPNTFTDEGELAFVKMIAQAAVSDVTAGGNFYFGLMEDSVSDTKTLASITGEPTAAGGYARQAITRDATGWPTTGDANGIKYIETAQIDFTATGADYSTSVSRLFLTNVATGTVGLLFSIGSALAAPLLVLNGTTSSFTYRLYLR